MESVHGRFARSATPSASNTNAMIAVVAQYRSLSFSKSDPPPRPPSSMDFVPRYWNRLTGRSQMSVERTAPRTLSINVRFSELWHERREPTAGSACRGPRLMSEIKMPRNSLFETISDTLADAGRGTAKCPVTPTGPLCRIGPHAPRRSSWSAYVILARQQRWRLDALSRNRREPRRNWCTSHGSATCCIALQRRNWSTEGGT
jgi:hypothetical protein